jgi:Icc-related predicted phosphoesterase
VRLVLISDTHMQHEALNLPDGDILVHAGDGTSRGTPREVMEFMTWLGDQPHEHVVLIAGNHDFLAEQDRERFRQYVPDGVTYLEDAGTTIEGVDIWGSPITPWFYDWAFNRARGEEIKKYWDRIPQDTEVLITHGPPHGILDRTTRGDLAGCEELRKRVDVIRPRLHVFGHIHEAHGRVEQSGTTFVNACVLDGQYQHRFEPTVVDL